MEFEKFKTMHFPRDVFVGHGVLENVALVVYQNLKSGPALVLTGYTTYDLAGKEVEAILQNNNIEVVCLKLGKADRENLARSLAAALELKSSPCNLADSFQSRIAVRLDITSAAPAARYLNGAFTRIAVSAIIATGIEPSSETLSLLDRMDALGEAIPS